MASAAQNPETQPGNGMLADEERRLAEIRRTERERQKQALYLQRELVLSQRTSSPARRSALEAALAQIESQIAALE
ncbi:MAG TPA: hypothetical protein VMU48_01730 [Terracidiphilus sp.]|nr:hypothetical protein [Terracidiphilus sp.]